MLSIPLKRGGEIQAPLFITPRWQMLRASPFQVVTTDRALAGRLHVVAQHACFRSLCRCHQS